MQGRFDRQMSILLDGLILKLSLFLAFEGVHYLSLYIMFHIHRHCVHSILPLALSSHDRIRLFSLSETEYLETEFKILKRRDDYNYCATQNIQKVASRSGLKGVELLWLARLVIK